MNNHGIKSFAFQARLLLLTALISLVCFAFVAQFSDTTTYIDDTQRVRVAEMQEPSVDSDFELQSGYLDGFFTPLVLVFTGAFVSICNFIYQVLGRLTCLYHVRSRSPPLF